MFGTMTLNTNSRRTAARKKKPDSFRENREPIRTVEISSDMLLG